MDPYGSSSYIPVLPYGVEIPNRVFVGGISYSTTELELKEFFGQFGHVKDSKIITDRSGVSKGYGFITFATEEEAVKVYTKGSLYYKEKKLNVSKAIRKQGGQYSKANQEYVNGQRAIWFHPSGYLVSQHDGAWHFEQPSSHSQPAKPCFSMYSPVYIPTTVPTLQPSPMSQPAPAEVYTASYYPALPAPSPTYTYITEPLPTPPNQHPPQPVCNPTPQHTPNQQEEAPGNSGENSVSGSPSTQSPATENDAEESEGKGDVGDTGDDILSLADQTKQLTLNPSDENQANEQDTLNSPSTVPNGIIHKTGQSSPFQSRKPPRYQTHRPPNLSQPSHLLSPSFQPNFQFNYPPPTHYPVGHGITYTSTLPPTLRPPQQPPFALNPISNISTVTFTSPPVSPNLVSL